MERAIRKRGTRPSVNWLPLPRKRGTPCPRNTCARHPERAYRLSGPGVPHSPSDEGSRPSDKGFPALGNRHPSTRKKPPGDGKRRTRASVKRYPITGTRGDRPSDKGCPSLGNGVPFPPWSGNPCLGQRVPDRGNGYRGASEKGHPSLGKGYPTPGNA